MLWLKYLLRLSLYKRNTDRRDELLQHPKRGAYTELQILELLQAANTPWSNCASAIDLESLQPSELHVLLGVFADEKWDSDSEALLRPVLKEQLMPAALRTKLDWTKPVRIVHNVMLPEQWRADNISQTLPLQKCDFKLQIEHSHREGMTRVTVYICISSPVNSKLSQAQAEGPCSSIHNLLCAHNGTVRQDVQDSTSHLHQRSRRRMLDLIRVAGLLWRFGKALSS